jgi:hypothetical protein
VAAKLTQKGDQVWRNVALMGKKIKKSPQTNSNRKCILKLVCKIFLCLIQIVFEEKNTYQVGHRYWQFGAFFPNYLGPNVMIFKNIFGEQFGEIKMLLVHAKK